MADSNFRGPLNSMGSLEVDAATASVYPLDGPSMLYQGQATPDIRSAPFAKDGFRPGQQPAFLNGNLIVVIDAIPQLRASTLIAAAQVATALGSTVALVTTQAAGVAGAANIAVGVPIIPLGTTVATFAALALDFGFATGTTTNNSSTVVVQDSTLFRQNQWVVIAGAANSSASRSLIAQVMSAPTATSIQISPVAGTGLSNVPIGQANLWGSAQLPFATPFGPSAPVATAHAFGGQIEAGLARLYNPREMLTRTITVQTGNDTAAGYSAVVSGWDLYGAPMTELISASATTFGGKKAFKYISSITIGTSQAVGTTFAYGINDVVGLPIRADYWEQTEVRWNGAAMTTLNGFTAALSSPSTSTTRDVRGLVALSTAVITGAIATAISATATNGTGRVWVGITMPPMQSVLATPINQAPMFGVAQSTATS